MVKTKLEGKNEDSRKGDKMRIAKKILIMLICLEVGIVSGAIYIGVVTMGIISSMGLIFLFLMLGFVGWLIISDKSRDT